MFAVPSNGYRLEGASLRNTYQAGRDLTGAVTSLELRVTDQQRQISALTQELIQVNSTLLQREAENIALAARLAALEAWALALTRRE